MPAQEKIQEAIFKERTSSTGGCKFTPIAAYNVATLIKDNKRVAEEHDWVSSHHVFVF